MRRAWSYLVGTSIEDEPMEDGVQSYDESSNEGKSEGNDNDENDQAPSVKNRVKLEEESKNGHTMKDEFSSMSDDEINEEPKSRDGSSREGQREGNEDNVNHQQVYSISEGPDSEVRTEENVGNLEENDYNGKNGSSSTHEKSQTDDSSRKEKNNEVTGHETKEEKSPSIDNTISNKQEECDDNSIAKEKCVDGYTDASENTAIDLNTYSSDAGKEKISLSKETNLICKESPDTDKEDDKNYVKEDEVASITDGHANKGDQVETASESARLQPTDNVVNLSMNTENRISDDEEYHNTTIDNETELHVKSIDDFFGNDEEVIDQDDPFGFEEDREQEALLEAFRLGFLDDDNHLQKHKDNFMGNSSRNRTTLLTDTDSHFTDEKLENEDVHPNQALFDILNNNFDELDSFHVPSLNRLITSDEIKIFFVAFVLAFTPPKPFKFAQEYNHDIDSKLHAKRMNLESELKAEAKSKQRAGWLFSRRQQDSQIEEESSSDGEVIEDFTKESNEDTYLYIHISYNMVYALWMEVLKSLGIVGKNDDDIESINLIIDHIQQSLMDLGLLEIEKAKMGDAPIHTTNHDSLLESVSKCTSANTGSSSNLYVMRHAINEQYAIYLAYSDDSIIKEKVKKMNMKWFQAVGSIHDTISDGFDDYHIRLLPSLFVRGGKINKAKELLYNRCFIKKRFETLGVLQSTTVHLTDVELLVNHSESFDSDENKDGPHFDVEDLSTCICSILKTFIDEYLTERQSKNSNVDIENSTQNIDTKAFEEAGKAVHLMALLLGSLGFVTKELEFHGEAIKLKELGSSEENPNGISLSDSYNCMGLAYDNIGDFEEAMICYDRALTLRRTLLENGHLMIAETCHSMGSLLCEQGEMENAYILLDEALKIRKYHLSEIDESVADTEQWLGNVMREAGRLEEALEFFKSALKSKKAKLGNNHEDVADAMHNMAVILDDLEKPELSLGCYQEALRIRKLNYGEDDLMAADMLLCIGILYKSLNRNNKAISHIRDSIEIRERLLAPFKSDLADNSFIVQLLDLPDEVAIQCSGLIDCYKDLLPLLKRLDFDISSEINCLEQMGDVYSDMRNWDEAHNSYGGALRLKKDDNSELQYKIGTTCIRRNEFNQSQKYLKTAMEIQGSPIDVQFLSLYSLGISYHQLEQYQTAIISFTECLRKLKNDSTILIYEGHIQYWIGKSYYEMLNFSKGTVAFLSALRFYNEHKLKVKDRIIHKTLHLLGNTHFKNKQLKLALKCYEEEIALCSNGISDMTFGENCLTEAYFSAGTIYAKRGMLSDAANYFEKALETRKRFEGEENDKVAKILHRLGTIYLKQNEYIKAKEKLTDARNLLHKTSGPNDVRTAAVEFKLGQTFDHLKDFHSAFQYYQLCLEARENIHGHEHEEVAITLFYIGRNAYLRFKTDESIEYFEEALGIRRKIHCMNNDLIAAVLYELGKSYYQKKSVDKALLCYREALRIWKLLKNGERAFQASLAIAQSFEEDHKTKPAIKSYLECSHLIVDEISQQCMIHHRLGTLYEKDNNLEESICHLEKGRDLCQDTEEVNLVPILVSLSRVYADAERYQDALICNKSLVAHQSDPNSLAGVFHSIGQIYTKMLKFDESLEYLNKSLSIHKTLREPKEIDMAVILLDLAKVHELAFSLEAASDCLLEALRIFKLKRDYKNIIESLDTLGRINGSSKKFEEAKECYEDCLIQKKKVFGEQDLSVGKTLHDLGCLFMKMDDRVGALEMFKSSLVIRKMKSGLLDTATVATVLKIGEVYFDNQDKDAALRCFEQARPLLLKLSGKDDLDLALCNKNIGIINSYEGQYEEAITFLRDALQTYSTTQNPNATHLSDTHYYIGHALCMTDHHKEANEYLTEAVKMRRELFGVESPSYAESLAWLGMSCYYCERFEEALAYTTDSLKVLKSSGIEYNLLSAQTQVYVAKLFVMKNQYEDAILLLDSTLELYRKSGIVKDEQVAVVLFLKGKIFARQKGCFNQAIDEFQKCLAIRKELKRDTESESIAEVLMEVGDVLLDQNKHSSALNCYLEGLRIRKINSESTLLLASSNYKVGSLYLEQKKYEKAMNSFEEAQQLYSKCNGHSEEQGYLSFKIGIVLKESMRADEALESFKSALDILKSNPHHDNSCVASCMYQVGTLLSKKKDYSQATTFLLDALELTREVIGNHTVKVAEVLKELGYVYTESGSFDDALLLLMEASDIYKQKEKYSDFVGCLSQIGSLYLKTDKLDKSLQFYENAWDIHKQKAAIDQNDLASILYGLGFIYNQKSRHQEALDVLKISLKTRLKVLGKDHLDVAATCEQLGTALVSLSRYEDALKVCTTSLEIYQNKLGENHISCARVMLDIGTIYSHKQNYDLSLVQLQACLQFFKSEFGDVSEEVANVLLRIGQIHDLRVDHDEAIRCMTKALDIRMKVYGSSNVKVAETILNIARVLEDWGDTDEAIEYFDKALQICRQCDEELLVAEIHTEIGSIYNERNEYQSALKSYGNALSIYKHKIGNDSNEVGTTLRNIGAVYDAKNNQSSSFKYYSQALQILRRVNGKEDLGVSLVLNNLGINMARQKKYLKALEFCKEALRIRKMKLPAGHLDIADTLFNIANILDDTGNQDELALRFYSEALSIYQSRFGDENEDVANCFKSIGLIHTRQGNLSDAIYKMSEALRIFRMKQGNDDLEVASLLHSIGGLYAKQVEYDKALGCFSECLKIRSKLLGDDHKDVKDTRRFVEAINRKLATSKVRMDTFADIQVKGKI